MFRQVGINETIDHFRDIPMDSQTTDIMHFAVVFRYDVIIKALVALRSTAIYCKTLFIPVDFIFT